MDEKNIFHSQFSIILALRCICLPQCFYQLTLSQSSLIEVRTVLNKSLTVDTRDEML